MFVFFICLVVVLPVFCLLSPCIRMCACLFSLGFCRASHFIIVIYYTIYGIVSAKRDLAHVFQDFDFFSFNTASASKVGQFRPFLGEVKKTKRSADEYFSFQIQECGSTTLETTLDAFCERSFNLLDATNAAI